MNIIFYIICFILFFSTFCNKLTKSEKKVESINKTNDFFIKIPTYKLENGKYVTSVQYIDYENKLKIIIFSEDNKIEFSKCIVIYESSSAFCKLNEIYRGGYSLSIIMEVDTKEGYTPQFLVLNNMNITVPKSKRNSKYKFVSGYAVMSNFNRPLLLTELIESNIHFGVSKMVFYYLSASEKVKKVLKYYSDIGVADVYQFQTDSFLNHIESSREMRYYHLIIYKLNHCFYEYKTKSNHMFFLDLDEIVWPVKAKNYEELIESLPKRDFFYLHSYFFKPNYDLDNKDDKNATVVLPDVDLFSIKEFCPTNNGIVHKYIMINTNAFIVTDVHESISTHNVIREYITGDIAFIRHTRHYNLGLEKLCPKSNVVKKDVSSLEKYLHDKSNKILKKLI